MSDDILADWWREERARREAAPKSRRRVRKRRGNCYVAAESLYHLLGGKEIGLTPHTVRYRGEVHWYLVWDLTVMNPFAHPLGIRRIILDPTWSQFGRYPPYKKGRARGFLTRQPSKRARALMELIVWQEHAKPVARSRTKGRS